MRSITRTRGFIAATRLRGTVLLAPIAISMLSAGKCEDEEPCHYEWRIEGDTGIPSEESPRLAVGVCFEDTCAEGVLDTTGLGGDSFSIETELEGAHAPTFRLSRDLSQAGSTWHYETRYLVGFFLGRRALTLEARDDVTGTLLFRARYEATKMDIEAENNANVCRLELAIVDAPDRPVANP